MPALDSFVGLGATPSLYSEMKTKYEDLSTVYKALMTKYLDLSTKHEELLAELRDIQPVSAGILWNLLDEARAYRALRAKYVD